MASKFIVLTLCMAVAHGSGIYGGDYSSFSYGVSDPHTGDVKSQHETRLGDNVVGQYSLLDSDGSRRTVDYAAGAHSGFNAVVRKDPAIVAAPYVASYAAPYAAPYAAHYAAPYAAPYAASYAARVAPVAYGVAPLAYNSYSSPLRSIAHGAYGAYGAHGLGYARLGW